MSFKIKKWGELRTVNMEELVPGIKAYKTPGGAGINTRDFVCPWGGKILVLAYASDDTPLWCVYDPVTNSLSHGPNMVTNGIGGAWGNYSAFSSWDRSHQVWGNRWLHMIPFSTGYGSGAAFFYGWDPTFGFYLYDLLDGLRDTCRASQSMGTNGVNPSHSCYAWVDGEGGTSALLVTVLGSGTTVAYAGTDIWIPNWQGLGEYRMRQFGSYWGWAGEDPGDPNRLYASVPKTTTKDSYLAEGSFGQNTSAYGVMSRGLLPAPGEQWVAMKNEVSALGGEYWSTGSSPLVSVERPWETNWDYRQQEDGGYLIDDYDLDGIDHGQSGPPPSTLPISYNSQLGWYVGLSNFDNAISFTVYVLDPHQRAGRTTIPVTAGTDRLGWMGEYALRTNLRADHILPFPDDRVPSGSNAYPPCERTTAIVGSKEIFDIGGQTISYRRDVLLDLSDYPTGSPDWWFPGVEGDTYDGFWGFFASVPVAMGMWPDPDWGWLNPVGNQVATGMGVTIENTLAPEGQPTHVLKRDHGITGASFVLPLAGTYNPRYHLTTSLDGSVLCYCAWGKRLAQMPLWKAVVGRLDGVAWETIVDFAEVDTPGLGETNWTVKSVVPIPKCKALPLGGYLVGATLYFDPWLEESWEWTVGAREATFTFKDGTDTGQGWVPAKPGYIGPLNNDDHSPVLLSAYDEWTAGRSLYGPDALLVYDHEGEFVECLNSFDLHAPNGGEIFITEEPWPRLVFRIYRHGTYSDFAEGYGQYHRLGDDAEIQAPLYAVYDLLAGNGSLQPGAGEFHGFVEMFKVGDHSPQDEDWRWDTVAGTLYPTGSDIPGNEWAPPGAAYVRAGRGGGGLTLLTPGFFTARTGTRGVGRRI